MKFLEYRAMWQSSVALLISVVSGSALRAELIPQIAQTLNPKSRPI